MSYDQSSARAFLTQNARLLERRLAAHHFDAPDPGGVRAALAAYGTDGLYGYALEPDKRAAAPQPIDQEEALRVLDQITPKQAELTALCDALPALCNADGGLPFSHPTVESAAHAPWWGCPEAQPSALNPTASVAGLLHKHGADHPWLTTATQFCWKKLEHRDEIEMHSLRAILTFLADVPDRETAAATLEALAPVIRAETAQAGEEGYHFGPLDFAPAPGWIADQLFSPDDIAADLDRLAARQQPDGGWSIPWPSLSPGVELESRGKVTLNALLCLRAYGR